MSAGERRREVAGDSARGVGGNAVGVLIATGTGLAITFLTYVVIARALGPDGRGAVAVLQTDAILGASLLSLGVPWALYFYAGQSRGPQPALMGISLVHAGALAVIAVALALALRPTLSHAQDLPDDLALYLLVAAFIPLTFLEYAYVDMLRAQRRFALANGLFVGGRALGLAIVVVFVAVLDQGLRTALIALIAASGLQVVATLPAHARRGIAYSRDVARGVYAYGLRVHGASVARLLSRRFDVLVLSFFVAPGAVGTYAVAQTFAELTLLLPQAFGLALSPRIIRREAGPDETHRLVRVNGTVALAAVLVLGLTAPWSVVLAFGDSFEPAVIPLLILLPGAWMFACGDMVSHVLAARGRPGTSSILAGCQAALTIALDLALVPAYGVDGAAVASTVTYSLYGVASLAVVARHDGVSPARLLVATPREAHDGLRALVGALRR